MTRQRYMNKEIDRIFQFPLHLIKTLCIYMETGSSVGVSTLKSWWRKNKVSEKWRRKKATHTENK